MQNTGTVGVFRYTQIERPIENYPQLCDECLDKMHAWHPGQEFETAMRLGSRRVTIGGIQITLYQVDFIFRTYVRSGYHEWST